MKTLLLSAVLALALPAAHAVTLVPGHSVVLPGTSIVNQQELAGTVLAVSLSNFSYGASSLEKGAFGQVQSMVVQRLDGTLDFYWQIFNATGSLGNVGNLRLGNFKTSTFEVNWRYDQDGTVAPKSAYQSASYASFNFEFFKTDELYNPSSYLGQITPGSVSHTLFMHTDAHDYEQLAYMDVANGASTAVSSLIYTFGPSAVPEPATYALFGLGLLLIGLRRNQR